MNFYLIGYFPKRRVTRDTWESIQMGQSDYAFPAPDLVEQICSVSNCIVKGLVGFDYPDISMNSFNQYGGFNQLKAALEVMAKEHTDEFELYAYGISDVLYDDGQSQPLEIGCVEPDEIDDDSPAFQKLGYDVVEMRYCSFGCSPLSCNGQASMNQAVLNRYCLVEQQVDAIKLACDFSVTKPEPGPYCIVEVWKYVGRLDTNSNA
jgi:hypothetical protein